MNADPTETHHTDPFAVEAKPELVFGIVGPLGVDQDQIVEILQQELDRVGYTYSVIRLSELLSSVKGLRKNAQSHPEHERIKTHMDLGTELRRRTKIGGILVRIAIAAIQEERKSLTRSATLPNPGHAYILRSLKHRGELRDLRDVYGDGFVAISAYAPKEERIWALTNKLKEKNPDASRAKLRPIAENLIERDEREEGDDLGQDVEGAFPLADVFLDASDRSQVRDSLRRFIELFFGNQFITPSRDEFGMYQAAAVALRSADLSRQVGASLLTDQGEVMALGCNDTPKALGGQYWEGDQPDGRDFALLGHDPSEEAKTEIVAEVVSRLRRSRKITVKASNDDSAEFARQLISGPLKGAQITSLLEFGRVIHAEMAAITDAAKRGVSTQKAILFCTTFPCHLCARLIIASGIARVVFIEPYPKSKTEDLYHDSVTVDQVDAHPSRVNFQAFVGVAPRRYDQLFRMAKGKRKDASGVARLWNASNAQPRLRRFQASYISIETKIAAAIPIWLQGAKLSWDKRAVQPKGRRRHAKKGLARR